jgi:hypothetical protein
VTTNGFEFLTRAMLFPKNEVRVGDNTYIRPDILEKY